MYLFVAAKECTTPLIFQSIATFQNSIATNFPTTLFTTLVTNSFQKQ